MQPALQQRNGRLVFARCRACGHAQAGHGPYCIRCGHAGHDEAVSAGLGTIASFTTVQRAPSDAFRARVPYTLALLDLDEGVRLLVHLHGIDEPAIGLRVRLQWSKDGTEPQAVAAGADQGPASEQHVDAAVGDPIAGGSPYRFERLQPGQVIGVHDDCIDAPALARWHAIYGTGPAGATDASAPSGFAAVLVMRAYLAVVSPRPPGNIHRMLALRLHAPLPRERPLRCEVSCVDKQVRGERLVARFRVACRDADGTPLVDGEIDMLWAA